MSKREKESESERIGMRQTKRRVCREEINIDRSVGLKREKDKK